MGISGRFDVYRMRGQQRKAIDLRCPREVNAGAARKHGIESHGVKRAPVLEAQKDQDFGLPWAAPGRRDGRTSASPAGYSLAGAYGWNELAHERDKNRELGTLVTECPSKLNLERVGGAVRDQPHWVARIYR